MNHFEYILLLCLCFVFPFFYSLVHRKLLSKYSLKLFHPTIFIAAAPFIIFDIVAVLRRYWRFDAQYITGIKIINLPVEEYLFFILIPQSCLLIWIALKRYESFEQIKKDILHHFEKKIA